MTDIGSGVSEIRLASRGESYRVIYVASIGSKVYVLHAFHKKSKSGKATPQKEKNLAKQRYKEVCAELAQTHSAPGRTQ
jgi:phage-related protein